MKYVLLAIILLPFLGLAQKNTETFHIYKADGSTAKTLEEADYFMVSEKLSDTNYVCRYYNVTGPLIRWETYRDPEFEVPHGRFAWYNEFGKVDSTGLVWFGKKDGIWRYNIDDSMRAKRLMFYNKGKFQYTVDLTLQRKMYRDHDEEINQRNEADTLTGNPDDWIEAKFKGGSEAWRKYLMNNLVMPARFQQIFPPGTKGTMIMTFMVDTAGIVSDLYLEKSVEFSADSEALRLLRRSPKWLPATHKGIPVNYVQRQSLTLLTNVE